MNNRLIMHIDFHHYDLQFEEMVSIGRKTKPKLNHVGIYAIGDRTLGNENIVVSVISISLWSTELNGFTQ